MSFLIEFVPVDGTPEDGGWPCEVQDISDGFLKLGLTWNRQPLDGGEATYTDGRYPGTGANLYVLTRLRCGRIVGEVPEEGDEIPAPPSALGYLDNSAGAAAWGKKP